MLTLALVYASLCVVTALAILAYMGAWHRCFQVAFWPLALLVALGQVLVEERDE